MSFLWDWLSGALSYLGLWNKSVKIAFTGLDNTGKTTLLHLLRDNNSMEQHISPTKGEFSIDNITFVVVEQGSSSPVRRAWKDNFLSVDAIVFMIDASDRERFDEAREELNQFLSDEQLSSIPILILGNKVDRPGAASEEDIKTYFNLYGHTTGKGSTAEVELKRRPVELFMCSVVKRQGYGAALSVQQLSWLKTENFKFRTVRTGAQPCRKYAF